MVYSSTPLYLDPHNWNHHQQQAQIHQHQQEHQNHLLGSNHGGQHHEIALQMPPPPAGSQAVGGGNSSSIRPGSMADRARQAKIPQPEPGLKCPRCESTNTKFCYFNNYSLTQPRHFCKMCRRYWTRGGALRNVPVGGGCRRNKRSSSSSKNGGGSKALGDQRQAGAGPSHNSTSPLSSNSNNTDIINNNNNNNPNLLEASLPDGQNFQPRLTQFPLLASLQGGLNHHGGQYGYPSSNLGLSFNNGMMGSAGQAELGFQIGAASSVNNNTDQQWRPHHYFPNFLASLDPHQGPHRTPSSSSLYQFPIDHHSMDQQVANPTLNRSLSIARSAAMNQQPVRPSNTSTDQQSNEAAAAAVKPEEPTSQGSGMNSLSRSLLGMADNSQYWATDDNNSATTWTDLSGLNSSTTRLL